MLVIRTVQMQAIRSAIDKESSLMFARRVKALVEEYGQMDGPEQEALQLKRAYDWADRLRLNHSQTLRLAEIIITKFGGFPNGPLPKAAMKILYSKQIQIDSRLALLESTEG